MTDWKPVPGNIMTRWGKDLSPENVWEEYPRPQMARPKWENLNGLWTFAVTPKRSDKHEFDREILVPFAIESALSGVKRPLQPDEMLWYRRTFSIPDDWVGERVLLHFGAVDWECNVWVNGVQVGTHRGGYLPFHFDITNQLLPASSLSGGSEGSENEIVVSVWDPTDQSWIARGKQVLGPKGIWYTAVSGIWQTVWLEPVPETSIQGLKLTPDIDAQTLMVVVRLDGEKEDSQVQVTALDSGVQIGSVSGRARQALTIPVPNPRLWCPESPHLYELQVEVRQQEKTIDQVKSYFGMRKFNLQPDSQGRLRLCLNNEPLFHYGPLDQGYWPDGLHTPPSEEAMLFDVEWLKSVGCNMLRKHIKVEPARFYYDCDRLGMIVWQDMPNGGKPVGDVVSFLAIMFGRFSWRDDRWYWRAGRGSQESRDDYWTELREMVDYLHNFTCIGMWVPFNEAWGQFDANQVADWLQGYDPTRTVDHASGWFDQRGGDFRSIHTYFKDLAPEDPDERRGVILSEFGGYALKLDGHVWNPETEFGYKKFDSKEALTDAYVDLLESQLKPWVEGGLSGAVYTQTSDVEIEINGYFTYDREIEKMDSNRLKKIHQELISGELD
ncbi:glycoside hydrolase family 2 protein [Chloroflexota bacterium]